MKEAIREVLREFYQGGVPDDVAPRDVDYAEKLRAATVIKGMRRVGTRPVGHDGHRLLHRPLPGRRGTVHAAESRGALVTRVMPGTPAAKAGLVEGDILLSARLKTSQNKRALDDENSSSGFDWSEYFGAFEGGDEDMLGMMFDREYSPWSNVEAGVNRVFTSFGIGKKVIVDYVRDGERKEVELTLEQAPVHIELKDRADNVRK